MRVTLTIITLLTAFVSCNTPQVQEEAIGFPEGSTAPEWTRNASIYEVNIRQYTPEGTINAFSEHLQEIKDLGTDILWLMPIYPIGEVNRKGSMGSPYSIKDYRAVNPDYGTINDLKLLVTKAHSMGMYVILDWVNNHTAWDNLLTVEHPDWYKKDSLGNFTPPVPDWSDVIALKHDNKDLSNYLVNSMKFWIDNVDIDGFRCDAAWAQTTPYWEEVRKELDQTKNVFMLGESEDVDHLNYAFDMNYSWELLHITEGFSKGEKTVVDIRNSLQKDLNNYQSDAIRMRFTTNHDENSWAGTVTERYGDGNKAFAALSFTIPGMPLIYSGQEAGLNKRLEFFEKDTINWQDNFNYREFYTSLIKLKKNNKALWNGEYGGLLKELTTSQPDKIFAFSREKDGDKIIAVFNFSDEVTEVDFNSPLGLDGLTDLFNKDGLQQLSGETITFEPWAFIILTSKK